MAYDSWASQINGLPLSVHFYILDKSDWGVGGNNLIPFSAGQVINLLYMPFLTKADFQHGSVMTYDYDQKYFGTVKPTASSPEDYLTPAPKVFKIYGNTNIQPKVLGSFKRYPVDMGKVSGRSWKNESKLFQYPYHFVTINDYINAPLLLKNEFIPANFTDMVEVKVYQPITMTGGYTIYVDGYKGDKSGVGANEGMMASAGLDLPTASSEYAQFMATSKAQFQAQQNAGARNEFMQGATGIISAIGAGIAVGAGILASPVTGGTSAVAGMALGSAMMGTAISAGVAKGGTQAIGSSLNVANERRNRIEQANAKVSDMMNAPRNVNMSSCDILATLNKNDKKVIANRYMISPYYRQKLADYWHLFGYKQNKVMAVNTKNRKYWNYVKTMDANIQSSAMDKSEIEIINAIYDKGIRFWHQGAGEMFSYEKDNVEV